MTRKLYKQFLTAFLSLATFIGSAANDTIFSNKVNTLHVTVDDDFLSPAVIAMGSGQTVSIEFDEMSHDSRRLTYHIDHCNPDWTTSVELTESDYLEGFIEPSV